MSQPHNLPPMWVNYNSKGGADLCSADPLHPIIQECKTFDEATQVMEQIVNGEREIDLQPVP